MTKANIRNEILNWMSGRVFTLKDLGEWLKSRPVKLRIAYRDEAYDILDSGIVTSWFDSYKLSA